MFFEIFKNVALKMIILLQDKYFSPFSNVHKLASYLWACSHPFNHLFYSLASTEIKIL